MNISDFIYHSESEFILNISLMLEKALNDKLFLNESEKKALQDIIDTSKVLEDKIYEFSISKKEEE